VSSKLGDFQLFLSDEDRIRARTPSVVEVLDHDHDGWRGCSKVKNLKLCAGFDVEQCAAIGRGLASFTAPQSLTAYCTAEGLAHVLSSLARGSCPLLREIEIASFAVEHDDNDDAEEIP